MDPNLALMLQRLELELQQTTLDQLLADDFIEFGASGKRYTKQDLLTSLPASRVVSYRSSGFEAKELAPGVVLLTYQTSSQDPASGRATHSLRSSIWQQHGGTWKLVFHQGTPVRD
jgi:hypothetical protein